MQDPLEPISRLEDRRTRERETIRAMVGLYCRGRHPAGTPGLARGQGCARPAQPPGAVREAVPGGNGDTTGAQRSHPGDASLCVDCRSLLDYALMRLDRCPYGDAKPVCTKCIVHCYRPAMREQIRLVMRYSGPRMLLAHPWLALLHWISASRGGHPSRPEPR